MERGVDRALEESSDNNNSDNACVRNNNNNKHDDGSGGILNSEVIIGNSDDSENQESQYEAASESEENDDDLLAAERNLQLLKKKHQVLQQQSKRARIKRETAEVEKALKQLEKENGKHKIKKSNVTAKSLRAMDEVVSEVDRLMDRHMNIKAADSSSGEEEESDVLSVCDSSGGVRRNKKKEVKPLKQKQPEKKVSGKSKNSLNSDIRFPQKWPHSGLNPLFVNSREKNYEDLSISEFCAGYLTILEDEDCEERRAYRTAHLKELMYLSTRFRWRCVLDYHGACLMEIERGHLKWGSSFQMLQSTTLSGGFLPQNNRGAASAGGGGFNRGNQNSEGTVFCKGYQGGTCQQPKDHYGLFYGQNKLLRHICAKCWQNLKVHSNHPETSDECPLKGQQVQQ